jgi:hypothetical protein
MNIKLMTDIKSGDEVICIADDWMPFGLGFILNQYPIKGQIYTVDYIREPVPGEKDIRGRLIDQSLLKIEGIYFIEQPKGEITYNPTWNSGAFKKITKRPIDLFKKMLIKC